MKNKIIYEGITFDDVLIQPGESDVLPRDVDVSTFLTRKIKLNIPFLSAAMDTVTEAHMAISMAREGGIGMLHKNMSIERQAEEVDKVKRSESGMIVNPVTLRPDQTIYEALQLMRKFSISGIPVINESGKLVGILTNRDLRFIEDESVPVSELMTNKNLVTADVGTTLEGAEKLLQKHRIEKLPVIDKEGYLKGLITFKDIQKKKRYPHACKDELGRLRVGAAVGISTDTADRVSELLKYSVDVIVIDTAHGHSRKVLDTIKSIRNRFPETQLIAGNIATAEAAKSLAKLEVDAVKVGIGPGSICTTRVIAGIGVPQISAILDVAGALKGSHLPIIADGGIKYTGDVAKAIAAGAYSVMIGGLFAGTDESPGEKVLYEGRSFKMYRGMGSLEAMKQGSGDRYFQDAEEEISKLVPEGVEGRVPFKGPLSDTIYQLIGGLRASMGYAGAKNITDLQEKSKFIKITNAGLRESHPHDVTITKEAPNYQKSR
ncbi:MAG: IMP dehydrogenase [Ignavibacteriaceae bacterium]|nr:IMP dehydrogenase [Ignavibacteriaceae bacterium]